MLRALLTIHRYLGIGIGLLMAAWCLSGAVMLYVPYPTLSDSARRASLEQLSLRDCCAWPAFADEFDTAPIAGATIEMLAGRPVLHLQTLTGRPRLLDLRDGRRLFAVSEEDASQTAQAYAIFHDVPAMPRFLGSVGSDQWTVSGRYDDDRPLYRYSLDDGAGTELYVSSVTGRLVQMTNRSQRLWNHAGAVTHWLYFTALRERTGLWRQFVIWAAVAGSLLTATGLWVGVSAWLKRSPGRVSPYRGLSLWHHLPGLAFGPLLLAWVASGLLSMNPWGVLASDAGHGEAAALRDSTTDAEALSAALRGLVLRAEAGTRRLEIAPLAGETYLLLHGPAASTRVRITDLAPLPLTAAELLRASRRLAGDTPIASAGYARSGDDYFFGAAVDELRPSSVWRIVLADDDATRYYLHPLDGHLVLKVDRNARQYRWLFSAVHQWNFSSSLRVPPIRDSVLVLLLVGVSAVTLTGVWLALRATL